NPGAQHKMEVWTYTQEPVTRWTHETTTGYPPPYGREGHTAVYDPVRDRILIFGGSGFYPDPAYTNEVLVLNLANGFQWTSFAISGTPPSPRTQASAFYDPARDRMILFGGRTESLGGVN